MAMATPIRLRRNILWNLAGMLAPMLATALAIPVLLSRLGPERFGVVSMAWVLIGYLGILDLGLGRALTHSVAQLSGPRQKQNQHVLVQHATRVMVGLGMVWGAVLAVLVAQGTPQAIGLAPETAGEASLGFAALALCIPFVMFANARLAWIEGQQDFRRLNALRIPMGMLVALAPAAASWAMPRLDVVLATIAAVRIGFALVLWRPAHLVLPLGTENAVPLPQHAMRDMLRFGGWLSVTNAIGPLLTQADRFYIAATLGTAAVAYYTTAVDVLVRLATLPAAMAAVLFPFMSALGSSEYHRLRQPYGQLLRFMVWAWCGSLLVAQLLGLDLLRWWLGAETAAMVQPAWAWLMAGILANGLAFVPYNLIQSRKRTDLTAKFHLAELLPYMLMLYYLVPAFGITGAAMAWSARAILDAILLHAAAARMVPAVRSQIMASLALLLGGTCLLALAMGVQTPAARWTVSACLMALLAIAAGAQLLQWKRTHSS